MYTLAAVWHPLLTCIHTYRCTDTAVPVLTAAQSNVRSLFLYCMCVCVCVLPTTAAAAAVACLLVQLQACVSRGEGFTEEAAEAIGQRNRNNEVSLFVHTQPTALCIVHACMYIHTYVCIYTGNAYMCVVCTEWRSTSKAGRALWHSLQLHRGLSNAWTKCISMYLLLIHILGCDLQF